MTDAIIYKIKDRDYILKEFMGFVDTSVDCSGFWINTYKTDNDYLGSFQSGEFKVYRQNLSKLIVLKITGYITTNEIHINIEYYPKWINIVNNLFLLIFSVFLVYKTGPLIGGVVSLITLASLFFSMRYFRKVKKEFIERIEQIVNEQATRQKRNE